jgi:hypothetical protein
LPTSIFSLSALLFSCRCDGTATLALRTKASSEFSVRSGKIESMVECILLIVLKKHTCIYVRPLPLHFRHHTPHHTTSLIRFSHTEILERSSTLNLLLPASALLTRNTRTRVHTSIHTSGITLLTILPTVLLLVPFSIREQIV